VGLAIDPRRGRRAGVRLRLAGRAVRPFIALNNAVNRQTVDGLPPGGWLPGERLPIEQALGAYTAGSAYAAFAEHRRGRIAAGMDADLVVLDRDLLAAAPSAIIGTGVSLTVVGGTVVHRSEEPS
jgi:predicted amidohydrolase YtcJ